MTQKLCFLICPDRIYDNSWRCHLPTWDVESLLECFFSDYCDLQHGSPTVAQQCEVVKFWWFVWSLLSPEKRPFLLNDLNCPKTISNHVCASLEMWNESLKIGIIAGLLYPIVERQRFWNFGSFSKVSIHRLQDLQKKLAQTRTTIN